MSSADCIDSYRLERADTRSTADLLEMAARSGRAITVVVGDGWHIVPRVTESERRRRVKAAADHVMTKHRKTFEKLAK